MAERETANDILLRAATLDAENDAPYRVAELRAAAEEAGISASAFSQALRDGRRALRATSPWWVRFCLRGVPSRRAAMALYTGILVAIPAVHWSCRHRPASSAFRDRHRALSGVRSLEHWRRRSLAGSVGLGQARGIAELAPRLPEQAKVSIRRLGGTDRPANVPSIESGPPHPRCSMSESASEPRVRRLIVVVPAVRSRIARWTSLLDRLKSEPALAGADWLVWDHKCGVLSMRDASSLAVELHARVNGKWLADGPYDDIILTGHSLGGLLVRQAYLIGCEEAAANNARPGWANVVSRIILLAAVNRGADPRVRLDVRVASLLSQILFPLRRLLLAQILRGSSFITNLRIEWIRHFAKPEGRTPIVVQILGTRDSLVSRDDSIDIEQFADSYIIDIPDANHENLFQLQGIEEPEVRYALLRDAFVHNQPTVGENREFKGPDSIVMIMHGIRADNKTWVRKTKEDIEKSKPSVLAIAPEHEYLSALRFAIPLTRRRHLNWFQDAYSEALAKNPEAKFQFIGHSNGTYLFGQSLKTIPGMRFERAVLLASVLPRTFDWTKCEQRNQIAALRVDGGNRDWPVGLLCSGLRGLGMRDVGTGGFLGFTQTGTLPVHEVFWHDGGHSAPTADDNLPSVVSFVVEGDIGGNVVPTGRRIGWFAFLGRAMVVIAPLIILGVLGSLIYSLWMHDAQAGLVSVGVLLMVVAFLEFF